MSRVPKTHPRIEAYGAIDELNAQIGLTLTVEGLPAQYADWLRRVQNDLFDVGADLSVPPGGERERLRLAPEQVTWLEEACDEVNATLEPLKSFVLPGGTPAAAHLHVCRTVCRRAERRALRGGGGHPPGGPLLSAPPPPPPRPLRRPPGGGGGGGAPGGGGGPPGRPPPPTRLSDLLFILSGGANAGEEPLGEPGRSR